MLRIRHLKAKIAELQKEMAEIERETSIREERIQRLKGLKKR